MENISQDKNILEVKNLSKFYKLPKESLFKAPEIIKAVNGVNFKIRKGKSFGVVGESGSGKSTLARCIMGLERPSGGIVKINNNNIFSLSPSKLRNLRKQFQMVFQDPFGSLNPRKKVLSIIAEPLDVLEKVSSMERKSRVVSTLESVGLKETDIEKYPHEFSGGQRQRIALARAIYKSPRIIVLDEPNSNLDAAGEKALAETILTAKGSGSTVIVISHRPSLLASTDKIAVLNKGSLAKYGDRDQVLNELGGGKVVSPSPPVPANN